MIAIKNDILVLNYTNFKHTCITLLVLGCVVPLIYLFTADSNDAFNWLYVVLPPLIFSVITVLLYVFRRITIGTILALDVNLRLVYELERRKPNKRNQAYNLTRLSHMHFFEGDFQNALLCIEQVQSLGEKEAVLNTRHLQILIFFITKRFDDMLKLIELQYNSGIEGEKKLASCLPYYDFMKVFVNKEFEAALAVLNNIIKSNKNFAVLNNVRLIVFYLMRMVYIELEDTENINLCNNEIIRADKNNLTFFSR